jgi:hypothetical protein
MTDQEPQQPEKPDQSTTSEPPGPADLPDHDPDPAALGRQPSGSRAVPAFIGLVVGGAAAAGVILGLGVGRPPAPVPAPQASVSAAPEPSASASAQVPEGGPLERAAQGEADAIKAIEARPRDQRTSEEALALGRGRDATVRSGIAEMKRKIDLVPEYAAEKDTQSEVRKYARDRAVAIDLLEMLATLDGTVGSDLMYKIWRDRRIRAETTQLAEELLYSSDIRKKASPALSVVLDLYATEECEDVAKILERAKQHGDKRAEFAMGRFWMKRGCGENKALDCWPCLRNNDLLKDAAAEARKRPAPL